MAARASTWLISKRVSPNTISVSSIVFSLIAFACLLGTAWSDTPPARVLFFMSALFVQCRLLANLFDGMVAVESGQSSQLGELYNEIPDRLSDPLILIGAGYAAGGSVVAGYAAALLAVLVAYLRVVGNAAGAADLFVGPMAKPHRMAIVTAAALYAAAAPAAWPGAIGADSGRGAMSAALMVIIVGCIITGARRIVRTSRQLLAMDR